MGKLVSLEEAVAAAGTARAQGLTVVATNGCFDIIHVGHIRNLRDTKALGDVLFVGINSDESVRENKGPLRPIIPALERAELIAALDSVDYVFIFPERTPFSWIRKLRPHIHAKGGGEDIRNHPDFPEQDRVIREAGGRFVLVPHQEGHSTSHLIRSIVSAYAPRAEPAKKADNT